MQGGDTYIFEEKVREGKFSLTLKSTGRQVT